MADVERVERDNTQLCYINQSHCYTQIKHPQCDFRATETGDSYRVLYCTKPSMCPPVGRFPPTELAKVVTGVQVLVVVIQCILRVQCVHVYMCTWYY